MLLGEEEHDGGGVSIEFDEEDGSNCEGTPNYMHSSVDYSSTDLCSKYLEDYLAGSFSRSVSFNDPPLTNTTNN